MNEGWHGWDEYAPFYDWENAQTLGRRDVEFWRALALRVSGRVLELGCGTGRVTLPLARAGVRLTGVDRSTRMLERAKRRISRSRFAYPPRLVRADIRTLPFQTRAPFDLVIAPYGILQSLVRESDVRDTLDSVARVLTPGGTFGVDLVPDLPSWDEYERQVRLRGSRRAGAGQVTLVESVRQDRARGVTIFDQEFSERRGSRTSVHRFVLVFRTLSVKQVSRRLTRAGFAVESVLGDYAGGPWNPRADVWVILARRL